MQERELRLDDRLSQAGTGTEDVGSPGDPCLSCFLVHPDHHKDEDLADWLKGRDGE